jgi:MFS-type transporter involved in bile tolerance (Atg22 family)
VNSSPRRRVWAWAQYDWAHSAYATTVMAGFFPAFFRHYCSTGAETTLTTWRPGLANGIAGFIIAVLAALSLYALGLHTGTEFWVMAVIVGLVPGRVQSLSRSLSGQFVPPDKSVEYFGCYNHMGKFATVLGPVLVGATAALSGSSRVGISSLLLLFLIGGGLLLTVRAPRIMPAA